MKKQIYCELPNASTLINGIEFARHKQGMLSVPVDEETAAYFEGVEGYTLLDVAPEEPVKPPKTPKE